MHPDLVAIANLWQADVRVDSLHTEHEHLVGTVTRAIQAHKDAVLARDAGKVTLELLKGEERVTTRELDSYTQKRDATRRMLDDGSAPNYAAAERQLANCIALVDELETKGLELLDAMEQAMLGLAAAEKARIDAEAAELAARKALAARDAPLRVDLIAAHQVRERALAELPPDYQTHYSELRRRKRVALVNVVEGNCSVCHMSVAQQKYNEVLMKRAVHTCVGCGGYLLPS